MATKSVIIEMVFNKEIAFTATMAEAAPTAMLDSAAVPAIPGVVLDETFPATAIPGRTPRTQFESSYDAAPFDLALQPEAQTYIVRGEVDERKIDEVAKNKNVVGVFSDPVIEPTIVCPGSPALGSDADVERLLCTRNMHATGMDGSGVLVAIVDTGINLVYLNAHGKNPNFDAGRSWVPQPPSLPGQLPVGHGTMCAYDACIAAPKCTLLDIALLTSAASGPTPMSGLLSDAVRAYRHLINVMTSPRRPGEGRSMVVNNSWGMFHPTWDFLPGHPGNYSNNPNHPFNRIVGDLERSGADILFAAGNCGKDCPDGRCQNVTTNAIYGANGHPQVLCVAGVDTTKKRVGYSTIGPGRLTRNKPDISGYTHFRGSGVYAADGGTSAATPVVSGVVAAVRSKRPYDPGNPSTHPAAIRALVTSTAEDLGASGYDFEHGYGVINGCALRDRVGGTVVISDICRRYPWICRPPIDICRRYPWICRGVPVPPIPVPPIPGPPGPLSGDPADFSASLDWSAIGTGGEGGEPDAVEMAFLAGYLAGQQTAAQTATPPQKSGGKKGCGCQDS